MINLREFLSRLRGFPGSARSGIYGRMPVTPVPAPTIALPYRAFTTAFDRTVNASEALKSLSFSSSTGGCGAEFLDYASDIRASGYARAITFQQRWASGHELGEKPLITLLIDHSGSMRGPRATIAALIADAVGSALELVSIPFEVLGYTTSSWHGGKSRQAWFDAGQPSYPGRVCDLLHIVYRDGTIETPNHGWRGGLKLLTYDAILKENIDGEALLWAWSRASNFVPSTWICLVISDGAPVDDTSIILSGPNILHEHLKKVSRDIQSSGSRIGGIGIEFDVHLYYPIAKPVKVLADGPTIAFDVLEALVWPKTVAGKPDNDI